MRELLEIFLVFVKIGVMTFGGGAAMLPILQKELLENRGWVTDEELMDYYAIGQCMPGIIAVNTATFIGRQRKGVAGGISAAIGVVFPSLVIILILANLITSVSDLAWVQNAFAGIRACVCVQIFNAVVKLAKKAILDIWTVLIFVAVFLGSILTDLSPILFVVLAAVAGILLHVLNIAKGGEKA